MTPEDRRTASRARLHNCAGEFAQVDLWKATPIKDDSSRDVRSVMIKVLDTKDGAANSATKPRVLKERLMPRRRPERFAWLRSQVRVREPNWPLRSATLLEEKLA